MAKYVLIFTIALASLSLAADINRGAGFPHKPGSDNRNPGTILDTPPFTPGYHNGNDMVCSDCHIMHSSMQHNNGEHDPYNYPYNVNPPATHLLKAPNALMLCLSCHDNKVGIPDVVGAD